MVMDAAVVVAENIVRLREEGMSARQAALEGTRQVGGALVASTITTVAVFVPVIFMDDVEGQLFADLALTISIAVGISLLIAVTVLPAAAGSWLRERKDTRATASLPGRASASGRCARRPVASANWRWVGALVLAPALLAALLMPQIDYLPPVKRAAVDAIFNFPPGMSPERVNREIAPTLLRAHAPLHGRREVAAAEQLVPQPVVRRRHHRCARRRSRPTSANSNASSATK